ncbi:SixA phosphatase family protein [Methylophilus aquaticus]|uniref:Phosphoglycerate mutase family protein n=1 Tax=Methylophilus aquaticus TaxID=1971610 RepID=A0ABT9JTS2_9PROT|nr:phosphoglycerate mutase family protein [Methylophilus aquaticus]MDP8567992.1 phosphoglycerate mutase family protein [Methylophilus aquaticus]
MSSQVRNLILWRHAEAEVLQHGQRDMDRVLTAKGHKQAKQMAGWLKRYLPKSTYVLVSPAQRTLETAAYWGDDWQEEPRIAPERPIQPIMQLMAQSPYQNLMLVGHQPWIGELAADCLGIEEGQLSIKKGAVWWLRLPKSGGAYKLYSVQAPDLLA